MLLFAGACLYDNINGMVAELAAALGRAGCEPCILDLRDPGHAPALMAHLGGGQVAFAVSVAGFGLDTRVAGNVYEGHGVPLVSVYLDPLLLVWDQVALALPHRVVTSTAPADVAFCRGHLGDGARVAFLPHSAPDIPGRPWGERDIPLLFAASLGEDPERQRAGWRGHGAVVERRLNDMLDLLRAEPLRHPVEAVGKVAGVAAPLALYPYFATLDRYLRADIRRRTVAALGGQGLTVVGSGWEGVAGPGVRFVGPRPAAEVAAMAGRARVVVNAMPRHHGSHERLFVALSAGAAALSTPSDFLVGADLPVVAAAPEDMAGVLAGADEDLAARGRAAFLAAHRWDDRARQIMALAADAAADLG
ncbi:MAG: hypothetical protein ACM31L_20665 [Actinomycetota bacterium]